MPIERQCPRYTVQAHYGAIIHTCQAYRQAKSRKYRKMIKIPMQGLHHNYGTTVVAKLGGVIIISN